MAVLPEMVPVSDLRQDAAATLKRLEHSRDPIVITQRGRAAAVLMGIEAYERGEEERLLLRRLVKGDQEIQSGQGHSLEEVLGEAEAFLHRESA
ncbi:MAG: type II toxin-antitoxin system Phd/YefM family antitoxin [Magnetococcales bacterium]|nr:type II toxin-antitoxin system Phd/YefM family antitoxin [Magnetococcales bacterium]MBF0434760.1 type II toxin-antitoxin system Phd/YefM family antitoxin [Magnetococcales bacterium]